MLACRSTELQREYDATGKHDARPGAGGREEVRAAHRSSSMLLVGDRAKIETGLKALNLGDVVVLDVEGRTVAAGTK